MSKPTPQPEAADQVIVDLSDLKKYRFEMPNLSDDDGLDPYEFRLLAHYKRVGRCTESAETTAAKCRMSVGKVSDARQSLADKGWIVLKRVEMDQARYRFVIQVADRWNENFAKYSGLPLDELKKQLDKASASPGEGSPSPHEARPSPGEGKKEPIKNLTTTTTGGGDQRLSAEAFRAYESEIGALTPMIADKIEDAAESYPLEWITTAIREAAVNNKRNWAYVESILKRWKVEGFQARKSMVQPAAKSAKPPPSSVKDVIRRVANANRG
jgi:DnaD/phage-associated family protein